jgi:hypothetical protein
MVASQRRAFPLLVKHEREAGEAVPLLAEISESCRNDVIDRSDDKVSASSRAKTFAAGFLIVG